MLPPSLPRRGLLKRAPATARAEKIPLPLAYTDELYALRHHIELVRQRLRRLGNAHHANTPASAGPTPAGG